MTSSARKEDEGLQFIQFDKIGESLQEIAADVIETDAEPLMSRWFHSEKEVDVFYWLDHKGNVIKQHVNFCGQVVEWNILEGIRTGFKIEDESKESREEDIHYDGEVVHASVNQAVELLSAAVRIAPAERAALVENFKTNFTVEKMESSEIFDRFGLKPEQSGDASIWERFRKWFRS